MLQAWGSHIPAYAGLLLYATVQMVTWSAFFWLLRSLPVSPRAMRGLLGWAVAFRIAASATSPLMENDYARHLWDGWQTWMTGTPYNKVPAQAFSDQSVPETLQNVLSEINYPDIPTLYSPVLQGWCALSAAVKPGALWPLKALLISADLLVIACLWRTASAQAAVIYGWCPLVIHEVSANAHADILALAPLVLGWAALRADRPLRGGLLLGIAAATKLTAGLAIPFLIPRRRWQAWFGTLASVIIAYLPFWIQGSTAEWEGFRRFAGTWEFNSSVVGLLQCTVSAERARQISGLAAGGILAVLAWKWRNTPVKERRIEWVYGISLLFSAVVNPWYLIWLAPFGATHFARRDMLIIWTAMAATSLSYATALNLGLNGQEPFQHPLWVRTLEYGAIVLSSIWIAARSGLESKRRRDAQDALVTGVSTID